MLALSDERAREAIQELRQLFGTVTMEVPEYVPSVEDGLAVLKKWAESAPQEAPLEIINRWISQVESPDFGSVPSKKTLLELLGYVREEIAASKTAAPQEAGAPTDLQRCHAGRTKLLMKLWVAMHACGIENDWDAQERISIEDLTRLLAERGVLQEETKKS